MRVIIVKYPFNKIKGVKMKTKKPNVSGYSFRGMFVGVPNAAEYLSRLKQIAIEQNRSVSGQARQFIIDGINRHNS